MAETQSTLTPFRRFINLLRPDRQEIISIYIYAIFNGLVNLSLPLGIQAIINFVSVGQVSASWGILVGFVIFGIAVSGVMQIMQLTIVENLQRKIFTRSAFDFAHRIPIMKWEILDKYYPPELINRFFDTLTIQKGLSKILVDLPTATLQILFGFILLSFYHQFFIIFSLLLLFLMFLIFALTAPAGLSTSLKESKYKYEVAFWLEEVGRTLRTFKLAGKTDLPMRRTDKVVENYLNARKSHFRILVVQFFNLVGFKMLITGTLLVIGGILVMDQRLNIGQFVAAEILIVLMMNSVEKLILSVENIYDVLTAVEKLGSVMDLPLEDDKGMVMDASQLDKGIDIHAINLSYKFPDSPNYTLRDTSFYISAGQKVCLLGEGGSGKSILLQLISGLYPEFQGSISYNKIPLGNLNPTFIRDLIGDTYTQRDIFKGSLLDNITIGRAYSMEEIQKAVEMVGLTEFIQQLPKGYDTELLPAGRSLSSTVGIQLVLARTVLGYPPIMLFESNVNYLPEVIKSVFLDKVLDNSNPASVIIATNVIIPNTRFDKYLVIKNGYIAYDGPDALQAEIVLKGD